ncbi:MAG: DNA translocase FtsK 4TM domain-containing protein [Magnetococcales bacterium]|nr:DNA translocase FtsK 4TM domain-containing protein [Magnetococcales bacterium]
MVTRTKQYKKRNRRKSTARNKGGRGLKLPGLPSLPDFRISPVFREGMGVAFLAITAFMVLGLSSYERTDPSFNNTGSGEVLNLGGVSGAYLSDVLFQFLGLGAWWIPLILGSMGLRLFRKQEQQHLYLDRLLSTPTVVAVTSLILGILAPSDLSWTKHLPAGPGGIMGFEGAAVMLHNFGFWGSMILLISLGLLSLMVLTRFSILRITSVVTGRFEGITPGKAVSMTGHGMATAARNVFSGLRLPDQPRRDDGEPDKYTEEDDRPYDEEAYDERYHDDEEHDLDHEAPPDGEYRPEAGDQHPEEMQDLPEQSPLEEQEPPEASRPKRSFPTLSALMKRKGKKSAPSSEPDDADALPPHGVEPAFEEPLHHPRLDERVEPDLGFADDAFDAPPPTTSKPTAQHIVSTPPTTPASPVASGPEPPTLSSVVEAPIEEPPVVAPPVVTPPLTEPPPPIVESPVVAAPAEEPAPIQPTTQIAASTATETSGVALPSAQSLAPPQTSEEHPAHKEKPASKDEILARLHAFQDGELGMEDDTPLGHDHSLSEQSLQEAVSAAGLTPGQGPAGSAEPSLADENQPHAFVEVQRPPNEDDWSLPEGFESPNEKPLQPVQPTTGQNKAPLETPTLQVTEPPPAPVMIPADEAAETNSPPAPWVAETQPGTLSGEIETPKPVAPETVAPTPAAQTPMRPTPSEPMTTEPVAPSPVAPAPVAPSPVAPAPTPPSPVAPVAPVAYQPAPQPEQEPPPPTDEPAPLPPLDLLTKPGDERRGPSPESLAEKARILEEKLSDFKIKGQITDVLPGPVVTTFELDPAPGLRAAKVIGVADDLARSIMATSVRVVGNIPGKNVIGIELPNETRQTVYLSEVLESEEYRAIEKKSPLAVALGSDITGRPVAADLAKMPHLLVAGTTGSGKSVAVNAIICSILFHARPDEVRFLMVDPKMLELSVYESIPHLLSPVVTDVRQAATLLKWAVSEMEERYRLMSEVGVRNLAGFNNKVREMKKTGKTLTRKVKIGFDPETGLPVEQDEEIPLETKPMIVIVVDELADLMIQVGKEVEPAIARLAQMARAAGLHLIIATQRPSVDVITGLIKANFPTRLAFTVSSGINSRTILDQVGAERLLGMGDGLYLPPATSHLQRIHAPFVKDEEVHKLVDFLKKTGKPLYDQNVLTHRPDEGDQPIASEGAMAMMPATPGGAPSDQDEFYEQAVQHVIRSRRVSTSMVQRQFKIGYNRAARIVEQMESEGLITEPNGAGKREVIAGGGGAG